MSSGPDPQAEIHRASAAQRSLWFLQELNADSAHYNIAVALRVAGKLDLAVLRAAVDELVRRHSILRATFRYDDDVLTQVNHSEAVADLVEISHAPCPAAQVERRLQEEAEGQARRLFDLGAGPLFRVAVLDVGGDVHGVYLCMHHIVSDGWSLRLIADELAELYAAQAGTTASSELPDAPQYHEVVAGEHDPATSEYQASLDYWREYLRDGEPAVLPSEGLTADVRAFRGDRTVLWLNAGLSAKLRQHCSDSGSTLYLFLLSALNVLLYRRTGQSDLTVGAAIGGRSTEVQERTVGFFVSTVPVRTKLADTETFTAIQDRVRDDLMAGFEHQRVPFDRIVDELSPDRSPGVNPIFRIMVDHQDLLAPRWRFGETTVTPVATRRLVSQFDLKLTFLENGPRIGWEVEFDSDLYTVEVADRLARQLSVVVRGSLDGPDTPIGSVNILPADERDELIRIGTGPATGGDRVDVLSMIEAQVARNPDSVAVTFDERSVTYSELDATADHIARRLAARGVSAGTVVALCLPRAVDLVAAILAVWKAGGTYLPLDPDHPVDRLSRILADSAPACVITLSTIAIDVAEDEVLYLDTDDTTADPLQAVGRRPAGLAAYVIYTSGSTGFPKGVVVSDEALSNYIEHCRTTYPYEPGGIAPVHTPVTVDLTVTSLIYPLTCGGVVALLPTDPGAAALVELLTRCDQIELLKITPAHLRIITDLVPASRAKVRNLVIGGDLLYLEDGLRTWLELDEAMTAFNEYGPTEATVGCVVAEVERCSSQSGLVAVGRPMMNTQVYVVDDDLRLLPRGDIGQICIGGAGLADGYAGSVELTAERFGPLLEAEGVPDRVYLTGDRGRWLQSGQLQCLGRTDAQAKIRGHRVEPAEVEAILRSLGTVQNAVVTATENSPREKQLTAYVVLSDQAPVADLKRALRRQLPDYMLPSRYVEVPEIPLASDGSPDLQALAGLRRAPAAIGEVRALSTPTEHRIRAIWQEVLDREQVQADDDFFDLGGDSLMAIQVIVRLRRHFGLQIPLMMLFENPTVTGLSGAVDSQREIALAGNAG